MPFVQLLLGPNKHWTEDGWAVLADKLVGEYNLYPVFLGAASNIPLIERIQSKMLHEAANLAGKTTLGQASAVIEQSDITIAVDTGLLHIAVALDRLLEFLDQVDGSIS